MIAAKMQSWRGWWLFMAAILPQLGMDVLPENSGSGWVVLAEFSGGAR